MVHSCNQHLVPRLRFDAYPQSGTANDGMIVARETRNVLKGASVADTRATLWTYPNRESMLSAFDKWLMDCLESCGPRPAQLTP